MAELIGVVVEGHTEAILVRRLIQNRYPGSASVTIFKAGSDQNLSVHPYVYPIKTPEASINFTIIDASNDELVMRVLETYSSGLIKNGAKSVLALRDLYCESYNSESKGKIDATITRDFESKAISNIRVFDSSGKISHYFSVMEVESWFIGMVGLLRKVDSSIDEDSIKTHLGLRVEEGLNPEMIYRPASALKNILSSVGKEYDKSVACVESLTARIDDAIIDELINSRRSPSFTKFFNALIA